MNKTLIIIAMVALSGALGLLSAQGQSTQPITNTTPYTLTTANTASGAASAVKGIASNKTYQVTGSTGSGTGTAVVTIQGTNDINPNNSVNWDTIGTVTLSLSTTSTSGSFSSQDRYVFLRPNASTLTGTTATYSVTAGF